MFSITYIMNKNWHKEPRVIGRETLGAIVSLEIRAQRKYHSKIPQQRPEKHTQYLGKLHETHCYHLDSCSFACLFSLSAISACFMSDVSHAASAFDCSALHFREGLFIITVHYVSVHLK